MLIRLFAVAALVAVPVVANATTVIDGSFEARGTGVSDYCYDGFAAGGNAACPASAWVGGGTIHSGSAAWGGTTTPYGNYYAFVQQNQTLSQTFTATATDSLAATWADSNRSNTGGPHSYTVTVSDGATTTLLGTYTSQIGGFVAESGTRFLTVAGSTYTLSFNGIYDGTDSTSFIDNVALSVAPEPATWAMLLVGFGLVGVAARRRSVAAAA